MPEADRPAITGDDGKFFVVQNTAADEGDKILLESGSGTTGAIILNAAEEQYFISVINETAGQDAGVHVEIVAQGNSIWHNQ